MSSESDFIFKFIIIGNQGVGKSCILVQFIEEQFKDDQMPTIGSDFAAKTIHVDEKKINLQIWDTSGQEAFQSITRSYYRAAVAALVVYDITNKSSFENLKLWVDNAKEFGNSNIQLCLVGNKRDKNEER